MYRGQGAFCAPRKLTMKPSSLQLQQSHKTPKATDQILHIKALLANTITILRYFRFAEENHHRLRDKLRMTTRTKEEQELLDLKIARIQKQNDEILRRQKEIEEDKRLAEQHNAVVKLRPSTNNASRERTPALKPSRRELREDFSNDDSEPATPRNIQAPSRGSFRGRGGERFRGQGDWKTNGPPPDPKSFLYDDERDAPFREKEGRGDARRGRRGEDRGNMEGYRGGREFLRGGRRGGAEHRGDRGRRGVGGNREQEAWRAERMRIDEARIQRQRSADGKWRREWDCDKIIQEPNEEPRYEQRRPNPNSLSSQSNSPQSQPYYLPDNSDRQVPRGGTRGGKGRGRLGIKELEIPLEKFKLDISQKQLSPPVKSDLAASDSARLIDTPLLNEKFELEHPRSIEVIGNSVKVSIPNSSVAQSTPKSQRQMDEPRTRLRSQVSYSSQSDEEAPRERGQRGARKQRNQRYPKHQSKNSFSPKDSTGKSVLHDLPAQNKPPLPPFRSDHKPAQSTEGEESWEDVTTSGAESVGEELLSSQSSPIKMTISNTMVMNSEVPIEQTVAQGFDRNLLDKHQLFDNDVSEGLRPKTTQRSLIDSKLVMKNDPLEQMLDEFDIDIVGVIESARIKSDLELTEVSNNEQFPEVQSGLLQSDLAVTRLDSQDLTGELQLSTEASGECTSLDISNTISEIEKSFESMYEENEDVTQSLPANVKNDEHITSSGVETTCSVVHDKVEHSQKVESEIETNIEGNDIKNESIEINEQSQDTNIPEITSVDSKKEEILETSNIGNDSKGDTSVEVIQKEESGDQINLTKEAVLPELCSESSRNDTETENTCTSQTI